MQDCGLKSFRDVHADENNILSWTGLIVPVSSVQNPKIFLLR